MNSIACAFFSHISAVLLTYFWIVEYSVYMHIKKIVEEGIQSEQIVYHQKVPLKQEV